MTLPCGCNSTYGHTENCVSSVRAADKARLEAAEALLRAAHDELYGMGPLAGSIRAFLAPQPEPSASLGESGRDAGTLPSLHLPAEKSLTFDTFSEMNRRRSESYNGFHESLQPDSKFTLGDWARMIASEAGEVCDATLGWEGKKARKADKTLEDIVEELADVITLCDLAIQKAGGWTARAVAAKFEKVNQRMGFGKRFALPLPGGQVEGKVPASDTSPSASPVIAAPGGPGQTKGQP